MPTRRIAATVCALCLAAPAVAAAQPYASAPPGHARSAIVGVAGDTKNDLGVSASEQPRVVTMTMPAPTRAADSSTGGWRIAAIAELTLLVICAAVVALVLARRRRGSQLSA